MNGKLRLSTDLYARARLYARRPPSPVRRVRYVRLRDGRIRFVR